MRSFQFEKNDNVYIVSQALHKCKDKIDSKLKTIFPNINIHWFEIDYLTNGQLVTTILALNKFKLEGNLLIHNCDTAFEFNLYELKNLLNDFNNTYAFFPVFEAEGDHWSFAETELNTSNIIRITEKERISNNCSIGTYIFRSASELLFDANKYLKENKPSAFLGEYYISPFLNYICSKGKQIKTTSVRKPKLFGKPEELLESFQISFQDLISDNVYY